MKVRLMVLAALAAAAGTACWAEAAQVRRLALSEYRDKMQGGWIGQMAGVGWAAPTEFRWNKVVVPEDKVPVWEPKLVNQFDQDDIYVELTFLRTLELHGLGVSARRAGIDFANSEYSLWHANRFGRENLRSGIAPPDSGHPKFSLHSDDIDYQIEADFAGLVSPGLPNNVIALGGKFGRIMNYGDGVYGGVFIGGMAAEAFFEKDVVKIVEAGLRCIPADSQYAGMVRDVQKWWRESPDDWEKTWKLVEEKYGKNVEYNRYLCCKGSDIDVKVNGAYVVMGLLYGKGDPDRTIVVTTRCGRDSDCNPSNAAGILFASLGFSALPPKFTSALDRVTTYSHSGYNWDSLTRACEKVARESVKRAGGQIVKDASGAEVMEIPVREPKPGACERSWAPGPTAGSRYTVAERKLIKKPSLYAEFVRVLAPIAPGWKLLRFHHDQMPALVDWEGRKAFRTAALDATRGVAWERTVQVPRKGAAQLKLQVGRNPAGEWKLVVRADGKELLASAINKETNPKGWKEVVVDLSPMAGKRVTLEIAQEPSSADANEAYWGGISCDSK